jgi:thioester reductase-like protein
MAVHLTERIVVTGFPDYLAWRLCALLLRDRPSAAIDALVRCRDADRAATVCDELGRVANVARSRFRWHRFDPDAPGLGLAPSLAASLTAATDIFHLAGVGAPCDLAGVQGTTAILAFAARCPGLRRFNYLSTAFVAGDRAGLIAEDDFDCGQGFKNAWEAMAFAAERLVRAALPELPITIYRPTFIVGDSRTGEIDRFTGAYAILRFLDRLDDANLPPPMIGRGAVPAHLVPVDYVAAAIAHLSAEPAASGQTFHLADPDPPTVWTAYRRCAALLLGREPFWHLAPYLADRAVRSPLLRQFALPPAIIPYFNQQVTYRTANTHALLAPAGIVPPTFHDYAPAIVEFYADHCDEPRFALTLA